MKRFCILALILALSVPFAMAQETEPLMAPGDIGLSAGLGYGLFIGALDFAVGGEYMIGKFDIGGLPFTYGAALKASYYSYSAKLLGEDWSYSWLGGGAFGTCHFALRSLKLPESLTWLGKTDIFLGLGVGIYNYTYPSLNASTLDYDNASEIAFGLRAVSGINYFLTPNIAITTEGGYYGGWGGGLIGVLFKF